MSIKSPARTTIYLPHDLKEKIVKRLGVGQLSAFVQDMCERELAGEFNQPKIDALKKEIALLESQNSQIQTKQQEQKKRSDANYDEIIADQLQEREAFRRQRKKPKEDR